jgi:hypothetical protein
MGSGLASSFCKWHPVGTAAMAGVGTVNSTSRGCHMSNRRDRGASQLFQLRRSERPTISSSSASAVTDKKCAH